MTPNISWSQNGEVAILPRIVSQIFYLSMHTLSYASFCLFNSLEKPLDDNINTRQKVTREKWKTLTRKVIYIPVQEWLDSQEHSRQINVLNSL